MLSTAIKYYIQLKQAAFQPTIDSAVSGHHPVLSSAGERGREAVRPLSGRRLLARGEQPSRLHRVLHVRSLGTLQPGQHGLGPGKSTSSMRIRWPLRIMVGARGGEQRKKNTFLVDHSSNCVGLFCYCCCCESRCFVFMQFNRCIDLKQNIDCLFFHLHPGH